MTKKKMETHAQHDAPDEPARQQLVELGADPADLERAHALGLGGGAFRKLLAELTPILVRLIADMLSGVGKGGGGNPPPAPPAPEPPSAAPAEKPAE